MSIFYNRKMYKKKNNYFYSDVLEFRDIHIVIERWKFKEEYRPR